MEKFTHSPSLLRKKDDAHVTFKTNDGVIMHLKVSCEETQNTYELWQVDLDKDAVVDLHFHEGRVETFFVLKGRLEMGLENGEKQVFGAGETYHLPLKFAHRPVALEPSRILIIHSPSMVEYMDILSQLTPEQQKDKKFMKALGLKNDVIRLE